MGGKLPPFAIADTDGTPKIWQPTEIYFPNGSVIDLGNGTVFVNTGAGGSGETVEARTPLLKAGTVMSILTDGTTTNYLRGDGTYRNVYEARSPFLASGTVLSILTDGITTNFLRGDGTYAAPPTGLAYAPSGATYIIQTNNSVLSNAQILASLSAGLLKNNSITGVLTIGSGGVDFENIISVNSPLLRSVNILSIDTASGTKNGFLLSGDWTTFNSKESALTFNSPLSRSVNVISLLSTLVVDTLQSTRIVSGTASSTYPLHIEGSGYLTNALRINNYILPTSAGAVGQQMILTVGSNLVFLNTGGGGGEIIEARSPLLKVGTVVSLQTDGTATNYLRGDGTYRSIYEARSPLLSAGTILSVLTDGLTTTYLRGDGTYRNIYEARSPFLSSGTILSILTDGTTSNFLRGDGTYAAPPSSSGGGSLIWGLITNTATTIAANSGYIGNTTATVTYTLPTTYGVGTSFRITEIKGGLWKIAQNALQKIYFGNTTTAVGVGGYLQSTDTSDSIELVCCAINSEWVVLSAIGNITYV